MRSTTRLLASILATTLLCGVLPPVTASAAMIETPAALNWQTTGELRADLADLISRQEVREALQAHGVQAEALNARVAALTDDEARTLRQQINAAPAGGDGVLGVLFTVFIVLLVTDILGLTKVFPFTRSIRH